MNNLIKVTDVAAKFNKPSQNLLYYIRYYNLPLCKLGGLNYMDVKDVPMLTTLMQRAEYRQNRELSQAEKIEREQNRIYYIRKKERESSIQNENGEMVPLTNEVMFILHDKVNRGALIGGSTAGKLLIRYKNDNISVFTEVKPAAILHRDIAQLDAILIAEKKRHNETNDR